MDDISIWIAARWGFLIGRVEEWLYFLVVRKSRIHFSRCYDWVFEGSFILCCETFHLFGPGGRRDGFLTDKGVFLDHLDELITLEELYWATQGTEHVRGNSLRVIDSIAINYPQEDNLFVNAFDLERNSGQDVVNNS